MAELKITRFYDIRFYLQTPLYLEKVCFPKLLSKKLSTIQIIEFLKEINDKLFEFWQSFEHPIKEETNTGVKNSNQVEGFDMRSKSSVVFSSFSTSLCKLIMAFTWKHFKGAQLQQSFLLFKGMLTFRGRDSK